jgi:hypothetical protein
MSSAKKLTTVQRWIAQLQGGDESKLKIFYDKVVKAVEKEVSMLKRKADSQKVNYNDLLDVLSDKLVDAKQELTYAYDEVDPAKIKSHGEAESHVSVYLEKLARCKANVKAIEQEIAKAGEYYNKQVEDVKKDIAAHEEVLESLG